MTNNQQAITTVSLPRPLVNKVLAHAQQNPENEVCGLIGKDTSDNKQYHQIANISETPSCHFFRSEEQTSDSQ